MREECINSFFGKHKIGFGVYLPMEIRVFPSCVHCLGMQVSNGQMFGTTSKVIISYNYLDTVEKSIIDKKDCILINYRFESILGLKKGKIAVFSIPEINRAIDDINKEKETFLCEQQRKIKVQKLRELEKEEKATDFFSRYYQQNIKEYTPVFEFYRNHNVVAVLYIDEYKNMNFLYIDGYSESQNLRTIKYDQIHYFEKYGDIHYVSELNASYSNNMGEYKGTSFSKPLVYWNYAFGNAQSILASALLTYEPAHMDNANTEFKVSSDLKKIDERAVLLNFYSDEKKQYINMELPAMCYDFLQTYLPNKKYSIVTEIENHLARKQVDKMCQSKTQLLQNATTNRQEEKSTVDDFKNKVEKLKIMREAGLLTDEEFNKEKRKLLDII